MMTSQRLFLAGFLLTVASLSHAQGYIGANYLHISSEFEGAPGVRSFDIDVSAAYLRGGFQINEWFGVEARYGSGLSSEEVTVETTFQDVQAELDVKSFYGGYLTASLPTGSAFIPYAIIGYSKGEGDISIGSFEVSESGSGAEYGVGLNYRLRETFDLNLEALFASEDDADSQHLAIGFRVNF